MADLFRFRTVLQVPTQRRSPREKALIIALAALTAAIASWAVPFRDPGVGLDPSWAQALVEATDSARRFGREIVFTYGPLHQAATSQISDNLTAVIVARVGFTAIWFAVQVAIGLLFGCWAEACITLATMIGAGPKTDVLFYLFALLGILAPAAARLRPGGTTLAAQTWLGACLLAGSLLATLVKLSYLGAAIPVVLLAFGFWLLEFRKHRASHQLASLAMLIGVPGLVLYGAWGLTCGWSPSDLLSYYAGPNLEMVRGYSDAMALAPQFKAIWTLFAYWLSALSILFLLCTLLLGATDWAGFVRTARNPHHLLTLACLTMLVWIVFKSSFVRDGGGHVSIGALWLLTALLVVIGFSWDPLRRALARDHGGLVALGLVVPLALSGVLGVSSGYRPSPGKAATYLRGFFETFSLLSPAGRSRLAARRSRVIESFRATSEDYKIPAGATADVIPWDITNVLANNLTYTPRPVPQSYAAYSKSLQAANKDFLNTPGRAPEWLIVSIKEIDRRLRIGLDSPALAAINNSYAWSHRGSKGSLVFRKKSKPSDSRTKADAACQTMASGRLNWQQSSGMNWTSQPLPLPHDYHGFVLLTTDLKNSPSRSILASLYRPFPVYIEYLDDSGRVLEKYRLIPGAVQDMIVHPIINNNDDFLQALSARRPASRTAEKAITSLRLSTLHFGAPFIGSTYQLSRACPESLESRLPPKPQPRPQR